MKEKFNLTRPVIQEKEKSFSEKRLEWFIGTSPSERVSRFKELVEDFINKGETQLIYIMIDYINIDIKNGKTKASRELFVDRKRFGGETFFQRILKTNNKELIEICKQKGVDYDPQEDFKSYIKDIVDNIEYRTLENNNIIDKIIKDFKSSDKYKNLTGFDILDYISKKDIIWSIIKNCSNDTILNEVLFDLDPKKEGFNLADINKINIFISSKGIEYSTYLERNITRLFDKVNGKEVSEVDRIGEFRLKWEEKKLKAENRAKEIGILDRIKSWFSDILPSPELNAIKDALKHRDKIKIEYFKTLLGELSKRDAKGLDELQYSYLKENNRKTNEFWIAMFDRLEELKNPHPSPEQQPQTSISTTLTKEQTPQVLEGEIIQPVNLDVNVYPSNKGYNKEVKPITIEGEYRKIDDGTDDIVKDTRVSYRDQGLIDAGHNNYKLKIKGIEIPQGGPNNIPETNNQRFTVKKPEVLDVEKVYSGGTRGPGSHIPPVGDGQTIDQEGEQSKGSSRWWSGIREKLRNGLDKIKGLGNKESRDKLIKGLGEVAEKAKERAKNLGVNVGKFIKSIPPFVKSIPQVVSSASKVVMEDVKDKYKKLKEIDIKREMIKLRIKGRELWKDWKSGELKERMKKSWEKEKKRARRLGLKNYMVKMLDRYNNRDISTKYAMSGAAVLATGFTGGVSKFISVPFLGTAKYREGYKKAYREKILELAKEEGEIGSVEKLEYSLDGRVLSNEEITSLSKEERKRLEIKSLYKNDLSSEDIINAQNKSKERIRKAKEYANKKAWTKGIIWGSIAGAVGLTGEYIRGEGAGKYIGDKIHQGFDDVSKGIHNAFDHDPTDISNIGVGPDQDIPATSDQTPSQTSVPNNLNPDNTTNTPGTSANNNPSDITNPPNTPNQVPNVDNLTDRFGGDVEIVKGNRLEDIFEDRMNEAFGDVGRDNPERLRQIYNMFKNPEISDMLRDAGVRYDYTGLPNIIHPGDRIPLGEILSKAKELGLLQE